MMNNKILIIDDELTIIETIADLLDSVDIESMQAQTADAGIELIDKHKFAGIIIDLNLNNVNGAVVVKHINDHHDPQVQKTPIILISGYFDEEFSKKHMENFHAIIPKPFDGKKLLDIASALSLNKSNQNQEMVLTGPFTVENIKKRVDSIIQEARAHKSLNQMLKELKTLRDRSNYLKVHTGLVINISIALTKELHWGTESTFEKLIFASYIKDYALKDFPDLIEIMDKDAAEKNELSNLVLEHPIRAKEICEKEVLLPEEVSSLVLQHHERPDGSGFPYGIDHKRINALSSLFIVANDLAHYIIQNPNWNVKNYLRRVEKVYTGIHFRKILKALGDAKR